MAVFNRRNAVAGWVVLKLGKLVLRRKAKQAAPQLAHVVRQPRTIAAVAVTVAAAAAPFLRRRGGAGAAEADAGDGAA